MPVDYNPKDAVKCWPVLDANNKPIDFDAHLKSVVDTTSKPKPNGGGGNPMQVWTWEVYNETGQMQTIEDYVVIPAATWKIKQLAKALGKEDLFKAGTFQADDFVGCGVAAELVIEEQQGFDEKNKIGKLKAKAAPPEGAYPRSRQSIVRERSPMSALPDTGGPEADDIPF